MEVNVESDTSMQQDTEIHYYKVASKKKEDAQQLYRNSVKSEIIWFWLKLIFCIVEQNKYLLHGLLFQDDTNLCVNGEVNR